MRLSELDLHCVAANLCDRVAFTWGLYLLHRKESMAGAWIVVGTVWALIAAVVGAALDYEYRRRA